MMFSSQSLPRLLAVSQKREARQRRRKGGGFRQAAVFFYSTSWNWFFNFSIFSASCLCIKLMFNFSLSQAGDLPCGFENLINSIVLDASFTVKSENAVFSQFFPKWQALPCPPKAAQPTLTCKMSDRQIVSDGLKSTITVTLFWALFFLKKKQCFSTVTEMVLISQNTYFSNIWQAVRTFLCVVFQKTCYRHFQVLFSIYNHFLCCYFM